MFLHSGASLHGHEYSHRQPPNAAHQRANRRSPFSHPPFSNKGVRTTAITAVDSSVSKDHRSRNPPPEQAQHTRKPEVSFQEPGEIREKTRQYAVGPIRLSNASEGEEENEGRAGRISQPETEPERCDSTRPTQSPGSPPSPAPETVDIQQPRKHAPRKATKYLLAYPAPRFAGKRRVVQMVLPKLHLQLQQVSAAKRPMPVIDVFPSSRISGPTIFPRLAKRFPRVFGARGELGLSDVVLVKSEDYHPNGSHMEGTEDEHGLARSNLVAIFSPSKKSGFTEIVLSDGSVWVVKPLPSGSFDFVRVDADGNATTARWARRAPAKAGAAQSPADEVPNPSEPRYTFSKINPLSRRHPVMATLTQSTLDIQDEYNPVSVHSKANRRSISGVPTPAPPYSRPLSYPGPPSRTHSSQSNTSDTSGLNSFSDRNLEFATHLVDDTTKTLISVTAIWLALHLGWSPHYKPLAPQVPEQRVPPTSSTLSSHGQQPADDAHTRPNRRCTWNGRRSPDGPTTLAPRPRDTLDLSLPRSSTIPASFTHVIAADASHPHPLPASREQSPLPRKSIALQAPSDRPKAPPRRATSTGAAFMQRHLRNRVSENADFTASPPSVSAPDDSQHHHSKGGGRGRRILSGDWGPAFHKHHILHRTPTATFDRPQSPVSTAQPPTSSNGPADAKPVLEESRRTARDQRRRTRSAYYPSASAASEERSATPNGDAGSDAATTRPRLSHNPESYGPSEDESAAISNKEHEAAHSVVSSKRRLKGLSFLCRKLGSAH